MSEILQDRNRWEQAYQSGRWDYLAGSQEFVRYAIINSFLLGLKGPISLLDVGCGEGVLLRKLGPQFVSKYTGLDLAQAALDKITPKRSGDAHVLTSIENYVPAEKWDAIVFNEVLYYTADPVAQIKKFERALKPEGLMIVSIFMNPSFFSPNVRCARLVRSYIDAAGYTVVDAVRLSKTYQKTTWQIYVVRPPEIQ